MKNIVITGQSGFIGTHLFNYLKYIKSEFNVIPFDDSFFENELVLKEVVRKADVIIHLAALNRHNDPNVIYRTNKQLVEKLIKTCEITKSKPHIIFASSTQEERDNPYGRSKKEGRLMLAQWAKKNEITFTGLIIPNVYGPFGKPFYNSVISTFSYQITHNENPKIEIDAQLRLIYVQELIEQIVNLIKEKVSDDKYFIKHTAEYKVSEILNKLNNFKNDYFEQNTIPKLLSKFDVNLFNTFRSYIDIEKFFPVFLDIKKDNRGFLIETVKEKTGGQLFYSLTKPGITRGNHFHTRKIERFCVIQGKGLIKMRRIGMDRVFEIKVSGNRPSIVDMPIWYTHNITNIGNDDMITLFWSNEIFDPDDADTYYEGV